MRHGEIDSTLVRMVGAEGKGPIRGQWTYAPISKGSVVRSADHGRQTPRRPRVSGLVVSLSDPESAVPLRTYPQVYISSSTPIGRAG